MHTFHITRSWFLEDHRHRAGEFAKLPERAQRAPRSAASSGRAPEEMGHRALLQQVIHGSDSFEVG